MKMTGANIEALISDMNEALQAFTAPIERDPAVWERGLPRRWTIGQHADHVAAGLRATAASLAAGEILLREGTLPQRPGRGPLQMLWISVAVGAGRFPRGGRAPRIIRPSDHPVRDRVLAAIRDGAERHVSLARRFAPADMDRLWIPNPFLPRWHYALPEVIRIQAVHARHHAKLVGEILA